MLTGYWSLSTYPVRPRPFGELVRIDTLSIIMVGVLDNWVLEPFFNMGPCDSEPGNPGRCHQCPD